MRPYSLLKDVAQGTEPEWLELLDKWSARSKVRVAWRATENNGWWSVDPLFDDVIVDGVTGKGHTKKDAKRDATRKLENAKCFYLPHV